MWRRLPTEVYRGGIDWQAVLASSPEDAAAILAEAAARNEGDLGDGMGVLMAACEVFLATGRPELVEPALSLLLASTAGATKRAHERTPMNRRVGLAPRLDSEELEALIASGHAALLHGQLRRADAEQVLIRYTLRLAAEVGAALHVPSTTRNDLAESFRNPYGTGRLSWQMILDTPFLASIKGEHYGVLGQWSPRFEELRKGAADLDPLDVIEHADELVTPSPRVVPDKPPSADSWTALVHQVYRGEINWSLLGEHDPLLARQLLYEAADPERLFTDAAVICRDEQFKGLWNDISDRYWDAVAQHNRAILFGASELFLATGRAELLTMPLTRLVETGILEPRVSLAGELAMGAVQLAYECGTPLHLRPAVQSRVRSIVRDRPMGITTYLYDERVFGTKLRPPHRQRATRPEGGSLSYHLKEMMNGAVLSVTADPRLVRAAEVGRAQHPLSPETDREYRVLTVQSVQEEPGPGTVRQYRVTFDDGSSMAQIEVPPERGERCVVYGGQPPRGWSRVVKRDGKNDLAVPVTYLPPGCDFTPERIAAARSVGAIAPGRTERLVPPPTAWWTPPTEMALGE